MPPLISSWSVVTPVIVSGMAPVTRFASWSRPAFGSLSRLTPIVDGVKASGTPGSPGAACSDPESCVAYSVTPSLKSCVALTVVTVVPSWVTVTVTLPLRSIESAVNFIIC